jgi:death on curing protein
MEGPTLYYLNWEEVIQIYEDVIQDSGGGYGIRNKAGIESAISAPQQTYFGSELYQTIYEKAAAMGYEIIMQHPFLDGNKRVGHSVIAHFLYMNGYIIDADDDEQESVILDTAAGKISKEEFTNWLKTRSIKINR